MTFTVAISGKGGTGKTMLAALLVIYLLRKTNGELKILVVDADPNQNLDKVLGAKVDKTVGDLREELLNIKDEIPSGISKKQYFEYMIRNIVYEGEYFDLLAMGRPEGPGCYCYVNHLLRMILDKISEEYDVVIMDTEAGLEHLSRRTTRDVDVLIIITDPTSRGIITAERIRKLVQELETKVHKIYAVGNRVTSSISKKIEEELVRRGFEVLGLIPEDPYIQKLDLEGKPFTEIPDNSPAYKAIESIADKLFSHIINTA
ncbi:MAG: ATP-binding protein [Thermoprotei archaeon]|nr:MAG: ATP-binding protein [Thermoprotei archaeon]